MRHLQAMSFCAQPATRAEDSMQATVHDGDASSRAARESEEVSAMGESMERATNGIRPPQLVVEYL